MFGCQNTTSSNCEYDLLSWLKKNPAEIGCILEKEFSHRDSVFNCDCKNYFNNADALENISAYYEGLVFPKRLSKKVHRTIESLDFEFEHGELRKIFITFSDSLHIDKINEIFGIPENKNELAENILKLCMAKMFIQTKNQPIPITQNS